MSATLPLSQRYMRLFGYLPLALRPESEDVLLICYGCGVTGDAFTHESRLSGSHIARATANRRNLDGAAMALPNAGPAIKLERLNAAAQTEFPKLETAQPEPEGFENERTDA